MTTVYYINKIDSSIIALTPKINGFKPLTENFTTKMLKNLKVNINYLKINLYL
jgi:2C-methyl-D-erythritol 2,4-cyclodiphosphate synthase